MSRYEDIINLPRPESKRTKMTMHDRAAQFSAFAALRGHDEAVSETERQVESKIELSEDQQAILNEKTVAALNDPDTEISITYFVPDKKKQGGSYATVTGTIIKLDAIERKMFLSDGAIIPLDDILEIN